MSDVLLNSCGLPLLSSERSWRADEEFKKRQQETRRREEEQRAAALVKSYAVIDGRVHEHLANWLWNAIDERIEQKQAPFKDAVGDVFGHERLDRRREFKQAITEALDAVGTQLAALKERLDTATSKLNDEVNRLSVDVARGQAERTRDELQAAIAASRDEFKIALAAMEERLLAVPGKLPVAKTWRPESVTYQAEFVCHEGALWQACTDTAQVPGDADWICVARAGRDARTPSVRGAYDAYKKYKQLDIVTCHGDSYIACHDNPDLPGHDDGAWQPLARGSRGPSGETGPRGRKGEKGARGEDAPQIVAWTLDIKNYVAHPTLSNGRAGAPLNLRPLFEQFFAETGAAAE